MFINIRHAVWITNILHGPFINTSCEPSPLPLMTLSRADFPGKIRRVGLDPVSVVIWVEPFAPPLDRPYRIPRDKFYEVYIPSYLSVPVPRGWPTFAPPRALLIPLKEVLLMHTNKFPHFSFDKQRHKNHINKLLIKTWKPQNESSYSMLTQRRWRMHFTNIDHL